MLIIVNSDMNTSINQKSETKGFEIVILWNGIMEPSPSPLPLEMSNLSNSSEVPSSDYLEESSEWTSSQIIVSIFLTLLCLLTISANSVVLYLFYKSKKTLSSPSHILLANLSFSDLLVGMMVMPILGTMTVSYKYRWLFGSFMCTVSEYAHFSLCALSMLSMTGVAFERYLGVRFPLKHRFIMTKSRVFKMIALIWILAIGLTAIPLTIWPDSQYTPLLCSVNGNRSFLFFISFALYWTPVTFTIILYTTIFLYAQGPMKTSIFKRKDSVNISSTSSNTGKPSAEDSNFGKRYLSAKLRQTALSKKLALVLITMLLMFGPVFAVFLMKALDSPLYSFTLVLIVAWIRYANSCVNPFLFALAVPGYKKEFYKIFLNQRRGSNQNDSLNTSVSESNWDENQDDSEDDEEDKEKEVSMIMDRPNPNDEEQGESLIVPVSITEYSQKDELSKPPIIMIHRFCTYCGEQMNRDVKPEKNQPCYCMACFEKFASGSGQVLFTDAARRLSEIQGSNFDVNNSRDLETTDVSKSVRESMLSLRNRIGIDDTLMHEIVKFLKYLSETMSSSKPALAGIQEGPETESVSDRDTQVIQSDLLRVLHDHPTVDNRKRLVTSSSKQLEHFRKSIISPIIKRRTKLLENKNYDEIDWTSINELDEIIVKLNSVMPCSK